MNGFPARGIYYSEIVSEDQEVNPVPQRYIVIELTQRQLFFYEDDKLRYQFPIAIGKQQTPTPVGNWHIINKKIIPDPGPFGSRWMGLNRPGYGIHGTNQPHAIGSAASQGCIRMNNGHIEQLFEVVPIGTPVIITP